MAVTISGSSDQAAAHPGQREAQIKSLGLDEMQMDRFGSVLRELNFGAIPTHASNVRQFGHRHSSIISSETFRDSGSVPCKVVDLPLCGSYHIVFALEFDDGIKWMLKISANGHRFDSDSVASAALTSEARTMQLIKAETAIPVPAVYAFEVSSQNILNVPFILMERIDGQPLYRRWFDDETPKASLEHFRIKALQSLAEAMAQLNKFTLTRGGALQFDASGKPIGLRGAKVVDAIAMWNRGAASENQSQAGEDNADNHNQNNGLEEGYRNDARIDAEDQKANQDKNEKSGQDNTNDDVGDEDIICEKGPFECPKSAFLFDLDRPNAYSESHVYVKGCYKALRMFIDLAISNHNDNRRRFVLTHPDLDVQNVLVAEDGTLRGLIDWDGVASVPREIGCAQYPLWLMRDWVPFYYLYDIQERGPEEDAGYEESSPAELASYRALYAHFMEKEIERQTGGPEQVTAFGTLPKQEALLTRRSLVLRDLDLAASSPFLLTNILCHILKEIVSVIEPEWKYLDQYMGPDSWSSDEESVDNDRISNSGLNRDIDKEEPERKYDEVGDGVSHSMVAATLPKQGKEEAAISGRLLPQDLEKVTDSSSRQRQLDSGCRTSSKACQMETQDIESERTSEMCIKPDGSSKPARLGWGRKLLCLGCNAAEKRLRRIAKFGHVLEDAVGDVAEAFADAKVQHCQNTRRPNEGGSLHRHSQPSGVGTSAAPETKRPEDIPSTQGTVDLDHSQGSSSLFVTKELANSQSSQNTMILSQTNETKGIASISPKIEMQGILARKAKLIEAERAKKKADHRANKAAIKEELKIWENIAIAVRVRGVSLEQLQMNQGKIARWVADNFQPEEEEGDDPVPESSLSRAVEGGEECKPEEVREKIQSKEEVHRIAQPERNMHQAEPKVSASRLPETKPHKLKSRKALSGREAVTATSVRASLVRGKEDKLGSPIARSSTPESQAKSCLNPNAPTSKQKGVRKAKNKIVTAKEDRVSPKLNHPGSPSSTPAQIVHIASDPVSVNRQKESPKRDISATRPVLQRKIIDQDNKAIRATTTLRLTPTSQFQSKAERNLHRVSGTLKALLFSGASCLRKTFSNRSRPEEEKESVIRHSSVHGSDDADGERSDSGESCKSSNTSVNNGEVELNKIAKAKEDEDDVSGASIVSASGIRGDQKGNYGTDEDCGTNKMTKTSSQKYSTLAGKMGKTDCWTRLGVRRISRDPCSGKSVDMSQTKNSTTARHATRARDEKGAVDMNSRACCKNGFHAKSEDNADITEEDDRHSDAPVEEERPFEDDGKFRSQNLINLLGMDMLDELRLLRMQEGFLKLLERY